MARRRFVAGAECPYCHQLDRLIIEFDEEHRITTRQCLACGRADELADELKETQSPADKPSVDADVLPIRFDG
ncbi:MAG: hypothetical protein FJ194_09375 [Gammaproteobacteria bacterium]|nr:hypothetical protein [Gammaproteobacteria bacterium]